MIEVNFKKLLVKIINLIFKYILNKSVVEDAFTSEKI